MSLEYYLGKLGAEAGSSEQASHIRKLVLSNKPNEELTIGFMQYILSQTSLSPDAVQLTHKCMIPQYGAEYQGLGGDDFSLKCDILKQLTTQFPSEPAFWFAYADCALLDGQPVSFFYPILRQGMLLDTARAHYPTADLFESIHDSSFSFDFDVLMLQQYYQPCDMATFADYLAELKEQYTSPEELAVLEKLVWKG